MHVVHVHVSHYACTAQNWNVLNACRMLCGIPISLSAWRWMFPLTGESEFTLWRSVLLGWAASIALSLSLHKHAAIHNTQTSRSLLTLDLPCPHQISLCFCLHLNKMYLNRHILHTLQFVLHNSQQVFPLLVSLACNGKEAAQRDFLSRWKWEFDIVSYRQHLFAGDMHVHWYVRAISSSAWHWWPSGCCKDWQKFSDSQ